MKLEAIARKVCFPPHHVVFLPILIGNHNPAKFLQVLLTLLGEMELTEDKYISKTREITLNKVTIIVGTTMDSLHTQPKLCSAQLTLGQEASFMAPSMLLFTKEKKKKIQTLSLFGKVCP